MKEILLSAYRETRTRLKLVLLIYVISVFISLIIDVNFASIIYKNFSGTTVLNILTQGFDRTVFSDLITNNDNWSGSLIKAIILSSILYLVISVFMNAGYLSGVVKEQKSVKEFFTGAKKYFLPFFGYALLFYMLVIIIGVIITYCYTAILGNPIEDYHTEKPFVYSLLIILVCFLLLISFIWIWSITTRCLFINGNSFFKSIKHGFTKVYKHFVANFLLIILIWTLVIILFLFMKELHVFNSASSWIRVALTLFAMQALVFSRIFLKYFVMASAAKINSHQP